MHTRNAIYFAHALLTGHLHFSHHFCVIEYTLIVDPINCIHSYAHFVTAETVQIRKVICIPSINCTIKNSFRTLEATI